MRKFLRQAGFSLAELMITMSVVAILAGIGAPNISYWMENYRLKAAARELYSEIQLAKIKAIKEHKTYKILLDTWYDDWSAYYIIECLTDLCWPGGFPETDYEVPKWNYLSMDSGGRILFKHPQGLWPIDHVNGLIEFHANGMTDSTVDIYIANRNNTKNYRVRIPSLAGGISVERYDGSGWQ